MTKIYLVSRPDAVMDVDFAHGDNLDAAKDQIAEFLNCRADELGFPDVYWGGENDDENTVEVVTVDGAIMASLDRMITFENVVLIYASSANDHANLWRTFK